MHSPFPQFKTFLEGIFRDLFELRRRSNLMESMSEKWVPFRTDLILGKRKKSHWGRSGKYGGCSKVAMFFLRETNEYLGLCEQERYRDGASMRGLSKGSAFCHALILRGAKETLHRRFGSLLGLRVGIRNGKRFSGVLNFLDMALK